MKTWLTKIKRFSWSTTIAELHVAARSFDEAIKEVKRVERKRGNRRITFVSLSENLTLDA